MPQPKATVIKYNSKTDREVWTFQLIDDVILLQSYATEHRQTARHKWRMVGEHYDAWRQGAAMSVHDVPLPMDISREAWQQITRQLWVTKEAPGR